MTELGKLQSAKMYIDKLANGINPLDDTIIPENDIVNNVSLSRCLFYVADTLGQVIENGGLACKNKAKKIPFYIPVERQLKFKFDTTGISITEITRRINSLIDTESMKKISHRQITDWLIEIGMLKVQTDIMGKNVKRPTKQGEQLGVYVEEKTGMRGQYTVVLYNIEAQHFIIDNIEAIIKS